MEDILNVSDALHNGGTKIFIIHEDDVVCVVLEDL